MQLMFYQAQQKIPSNYLLRPPNHHLKILEMRLLNKRKLLSLPLDHPFHLFRLLHNLHQHQREVSHNLPYHLFPSSPNQAQYRKVLKQIVEKLKEINILHSQHHQKVPNLHHHRHQENSFHIVKQLNLKRSPLNPNRQILRLVLLPVLHMQAFKCFHQ